MPDRRSHRNMSEEEIERLVSSLAGARPPAELRGRLLKARPGPPGRRTLALRPVLAVLAFVLVLLADVAALSWRTDAWAPARPIHSRAVAAELVAQQRELGIERRSLMFVSACLPDITAGQASSPDSYFSLRQRLNGGM